ncbi:nuclear transport factor 2 family protein [Priestia megaterium]|uniref:nuclear transport factor 2 family protein n=1 Tax=Priestia megaterium TaxID=1404 RepID=UPI002453133D|nr:nuclear transport factor 2 family protein [Priestia megaterium]MDH3141620.1 nuclear transport factor 2 family protein [Priestia megaterium]MED4237247.1 nuclear transport factor 2 family protein [Priestia megaterium]MED4253290.1 nuclear transport factor 2 family protein [Priestia megaterium]MED4266314.1 nuclear transport factor 2 family protein [Priestia megaterium]MED4275637.1 nuclear transport factor 2 family protein [Priestia megaterium]
MNQARVIEYEEMLRSAMLSNNVELLEELLSDELIFVNHLGEWLSKEEDINAHRSKSLDIAGIEVLEQEIKLFQELAVTITKVALNGSLATGASIGGEYSYTRVWKDVEGKLKVVSCHCSSSA